MAEPEVIERLSLDGDDHASTFTLYENTLKIQRDSRDAPSIELETSLHNVLFAHLSEDRKLSISFLVKKKNKKGPFDFASCWWTR
ncbi:hypothetical protein QCA50_002989 [Cerrena zonata]|uniref:Uncharacterized protein n=1 Tax=Cerrena zonata TaxID=2478898 RepID=A0AAW0GV82_9APHY